MSTPHLAPGELQVTRRAHGTVTVLVLSGELDMATTPLLEEALDGPGANGSVVLDLGELTFVDSHGLRAIFERAATHDLVLVRPHPTVARLLALTRGERVLRIEDTLETVLAGGNGIAR